nr:DUF2062 domain-containing protein [Cognatishimia sp. F0-27]
MEFLWPRGGWTRAARYVKHRLHRLPDPPHRIARGIFAGVFTTFTPFYGLHFFIAAFLAMAMRGNVLASLLSTFFGNPLTYVPIGVASLSTGHFLLGTEMNAAHGSILQKFGYAWRDLWHNIRAIWTDEVAHWDDLAIFYDEVFFPYMIGGIIPGLVTGIACYYISLPLISAYQNRRKGAIAAKLASLKKKKRVDGRTD